MHIYSTKTRKILLVMTLLLRNLSSSLQLVTKIKINLWYRRVNYTNEDKVLYEFNLLHQSHTQQRVWRKWKKRYLQHKPCSSVQTSENHLYTCLYWQYTVYIENISSSISAKPSAVYDFNAKDEIHTKPYHHSCNLPVYIINLFWILSLAVEKKINLLKVKSLTIRIFSGFLSSRYASFFMYFHRDYCFR